jgi:hypothetical protein
MWMAGLTFVNEKERSVSPSDAAMRPCNPVPASVIRWGITMGGVDIPGGPASSFFGHLPIEIRRCAVSLKTSIFDGRILRITLVSDGDHLCIGAPAGGTRSKARSGGPPCQDFGVLD